MREREHTGERKRENIQVRGSERTYRLEVAREHTDETQRGNIQVRQRAGTYR